LTIGVDVIVVSTETFNTRISHYTNETSHLIGQNHKVRQLNARIRLGLAIKVYVCACKQVYSPYV